MVARTSEPRKPSDDCLRDFNAAVERVLERGPGRVSLLDQQLGALACDERAEMFSPPDWTGAVIQILTSGAALDSALPESVEATPHRQALYAVMDAFRYEEDLGEVRKAWPRIRSGLRRTVLGLARDDMAEELTLLDGVLRACGLLPLSQPEPNPLGAALRRVLRSLLAEELGSSPAKDLRRWLRLVAGRIGFARQARFQLARHLSERRSLPPECEAGSERPEDRAFLADPDPSRPPQLPMRLVGPALLLLGALDLDEARSAPRVTWRGTSAYNVLRAVAGEARWPDELRAEMDYVLEGTQHDTAALARCALDFAGIPIDRRPAPSGTEAGTDGPRSAPARVLLTKTEEEVYEFLAKAFQEARRPTYDDATAEGWTRKTYAKTLKALEGYSLIERVRGRPVRVFPRGAAR